MADVTLADLQAQLAALQGENASLRDKATKAATLRIKVGEKGGVSVYGLSARFPTTLYASQWERLIAYAPEISKFIAEHPELKR